MKQEITQNIERFLKKEISLKKLTSELNKEKEYLLSLSTQSKTHTEIAYSIYFSPEKECNICQKEMKFQGFSKGYLCCKKCESIKKLNKISKEEAIQEIKDLYLKYDTPNYGDKNFKSFSQSCRKYLNKFWKEESKENWNKCLYDILYIKSKEKCKCCDNNVEFSSYEFRYSPCCSTSCMTKYQMKELNPWTEDRKELMTENIKKTKLERYGDENYNNIRKALMIITTKEYQKELRLRNEDKGNWVKEEDMTDFALYSKKVWFFTNKNNLNILENIDKRGQRTEDYHLDHKYSIFQGFKDNIPTYIIGNINNLEMINSRVNMSKNIKCSITKEELFCL